jgi:hypothetical protein
MSQPWKLLPLAAILAVIGAFALAPGGVTQPQTASAAIDCTADPGIIQIQLRDLDNGGNPVAEAGISVKIAPDPQDNTGTRIYTDNGTDDDSNTVGTIRENSACPSDNNNEYTASIVDFPDNFTCDSITGDETFGVTSGQVSSVELFVGNCTEAGTPTATATATGTVTSTPGPAATVTTSASPGSISCSGTSIVTIQVRDSGGDPVPAGTTVTITTSLGSVSPSSGQTTDASGNAFVFLTAPANEGGTATVTATSGSAHGSTTVTVNCGTTPTPTSTTAPPPTASTGGVISPPNTGDGGLADTSGGTGWTGFAGIALLAAAILGAAGIVKVRA